MNCNAVFGMWDAELFRLGPVPVDHLVVTQWVIVAIFGVIAFFCYTQNGNDTAGRAERH